MTADGGNAECHGARRRALAALCITEVVSYGVLYYAFPVLADDIARSAGWSRTAVTAAYSAGNLGEQPGQDPSRPQRVGSETCAETARGVGGMDQQFVACHRGEARRVGSAVRRTFGGGAQADKQRGIGGVPLELEVEGGVAFGATPKSRARTTAARWRRGRSPTPRCGQVPGPMPTSPGRRRPRGTHGRLFPRCGRLRQSACS